MLSRIELYDRIDEVVCDDPRVALFAIQRLFQDELPWLELRAVRLARAHGKSWAAIARALGRSRQAVQQRYGPLEGQWRPVPCKPDSMADRLDRERRSHLRDLRDRRELARQEADGHDVVAW